MKTADSVELNSYVMMLLTIQVITFDLTFTVSPSLYYKTKLHEFVFLTRNLERPLVYKLYLIVL